MAHSGYRVLWLLSTRWGTLLLCGPACITRKWPFVQRFQDLPAERIEFIIRCWLRHWLRPKRGLARLLKATCVGTIVAASSAASPCWMNSDESRYACLVWLIVQ